MLFLNEKVFLTQDGVEVPLIFLLDNLRKRFNFLGKVKKYIVQGGSFFTV